MQGDGSEGTADAAIEDDLQDSTEDVQEEVSDASEELFLSEETQDVFRQELTISQSIHPRSARISTGRTTTKAHRRDV